MALKHAQFTVADAVAYRTDDGIEVARLSAPCDRKAAAKGGTVDGDSAIVDFDGVEDGKPIKGQTELVRVGDRWYVTGTSSRQHRAGRAAPARRGATGNAREWTSRSRSGRRAGSRAPRAAGSARRP